MAHTPQSRRLPRHEAAAQPPTVPTGERSDELAKRLGLVPTNPPPARPPVTGPPTSRATVDATQPIQTMRVSAPAATRVPNAVTAPPATTAANLHRPPPTSGRPQTVQPAPGQLVRLNITTVTGDIDLAVPDSYTVAALLSAVLRGAPVLAEQARGRGGWLLALSGGAALRGEQTLAGLRLVDGTTLTMTGVYDQPPPVRYDDLADAVARAAGRGADAWRSGTRSVCALIAAALFGIAAVAATLVSRSGTHSWTATTAAAGVAALALVLAGTFMTRRQQDVSGGAVLTLLACLSAAVSAATATADQRRLVDFGAPQITAGFAAAAVAAAVAALLIGQHHPMQLGLATAGLIPLVGSGAAAIWHLDLLSAVAIALALALMLTPAVPWLASRLARFQLPALPVTVDEIGAEEVEFDAPRVATQTASALGLMTALVSASALIAAVCLGLLATGGHNPAALCLIGVASAALLLRSRLFATIGQRVALLTAGGAGMLALLGRLAADHPGSQALLWAALPALIIMGIVLTVGPRRRPATSPFYARVAEILDLLLAVAIAPLIVTVSGLLGAIRNLGH